MDYFLRCASHLRQLSAILIVEHDMLVIFIVYMAQAEDSVIYPNFFRGAGLPRLLSSGGFVLNTPSSPTSPLVSAMSNVIICVLINSALMVSKCTRTESTKPSLTCTTRPDSEDDDSWSKMAKRVGSMIPGGSCLTALPSMSAVSAMDFPMNGDSKASIGGCVASDRKFPFHDSIDWMRNRLG